MPWLLPACAAILFAAALLHWQRARHWCLATLAAGSLLAALGTIATLIFRIRPVVEALPSGAIRIDTRLVTIGQWLLMAGLLIGMVGGIGAIRWALRRRGHT